MQTRQLLPQLDSTAEHPRNHLWNGDRDAYDEVSSKNDRKAGYQHGMRDSISTITGHAFTDASISYSGSLQENVASLEPTGIGNRLLDFYIEATENEGNLLVDDGLD